MASVLPNSYKVYAMKGLIAPLTDTIKVALFTSSLTPNIDTQVFYSDIIANEASGTGYTAGGQTLGSITITQDNTNDRAVFDAADSVWTTITFTNARYAGIYKSTGVSTTSPLMAIIDFGSTQTSGGGTFTIQWDSNGIFYLS